MELARVFTLEDGIVEHGGGANEIDAELLQVAGAARLFPLEHDALTRGEYPPTRDVAVENAAGKASCACPA